MERHPRPLKRRNPNEIGQRPDKALHAPRKTLIHW